MNRRRIALGLCLAVCLCAVSLRGEGPAAAATKAGKAVDLRAALVGTWKIESMKVDGQAQDLPASWVTYKHVTPAGFTWLSYDKSDGKVIRAGGGTWTLSGDSYTEKIEYGMGEAFDQIKNASHTFSCRIDGDTWLHTGKLASGTALDEVWTRVKPAEAKPAAPAK